MKIGITHRLFLSILAATCLAILCMFLIMHWSIDRGFRQYLNAQNQGKLEQMAGRLERAYAGQESWTFLQGKSAHWIIHLVTVQPEDEVASDWLIQTGKRVERQADLREGLAPPSLPPGSGNRHERRLIILDAERRPLFGNLAEADAVNFTPLLHKGLVVGYLGLLPPKDFFDAPQRQFLKQQKLALALAAGGMVLVVAIFSLLLANRLVRPIKTMAAATHDLASGKYAIRIPVSSTDELGHLARDFNAMALTLEKNEKTRRQWFADISHELRTPLAVLRGEIEAIIDGIRDATPEAIRSLHAEALRLSRLVDDLYQLALSDLGALTYRKEYLNPAEVLGDSIEFYRAEYARKGIALTADLSRELEVTVFADAERLAQLFANLLDNSLKYTERGGKLVIRPACRNGQATVDFLDSAPGVPESELGKLFDRLYRVEASRSRVSGGAGLGLAICRNIVEAHAGTIVAQPSPLGGVLIRVTLPVVGRCS